MRMHAGTAVLFLATCSFVLAHPGAHDEMHHAGLPDYPTALRLPEGCIPVLSPDSAGVAETDATVIAFDEFFLPPGRRGLEFTEKARSLEGKRVRIEGFMVRRCNHVPGQVMVAPRPVTLHEHEMGFADDLPMATVFVIAPTHDRFTLPYVRVPLAVEGTLELGNRVEPDGRVSSIRIVLDGEPGSYTQDAPAPVMNAQGADASHDDHGHDHDSH
jgi:hypothetical protein